MGYLENWGPDVEWWDNDIPGNCVMGCFLAKPLLDQIEPYTSLNYGFSFLTQNPDPDQVGCGTQVNEGPCPVWDGENIYLAQASKTGAIAVNSATTIQDVSPSIVAIGEVVRMARMHPSGPKRVKIVLGGWSDYARLGSSSLAKKAAQLVSKLVAYTFADGLDIDMEHLTPFATMSGDDEFGAFVTFVTELRSEFGQVATNWAETANARRVALSAQFAQLQPWQQKNVATFYNTSIRYLEEVAANPAPKLEISWTTRFNAFVPEGNPWNYLMPDSPRPNTTFETDNEGQKLWPQLSSILDTVNIMAYDAGTAAGALKLNFSQILRNFVEIGNVPASKINIGFEPGEQAAGGVWEGQAVDEDMAREIKQQGEGGCMIWAVNPNPQVDPDASTECPKMAQALKTILSPTYAYGAVPQYTKCDPNTGFWPETESLDFGVPLVV